MVVSGQRDRIFSFFSGAIKQGLFILFESFGSVYFGWDGVARIACKHSWFVGSSPVLVWNSSCIGRRVRSTAHFELPWLPAFFAKVMTNHTRSKVLGQCHELLGLWLVRLMFIDCLLFVLGFGLYFYYFEANFWIVFVFLISPSLWNPRW